MKKIHHIAIISVIVSCATSTAVAQNTVDAVLGSPTDEYRADDVPAGEQGRYYIPGAAAAKDNIAPSSFSQKFKADVSFRPNWGMSCSDMSFYSNFKAEIARLKYQLNNTVKQAEQAAMAAVSSIITSFQQYLLTKINATLGQLSIKNLDEYIKLFEAQVKTCADFENDVANGKNPLGEIVKIAVGDQWETTIGLVNAGTISLDEAKQTMVKDAQEKGVEMADGQRYGGKNQDPINATRSLIKSGMNLLMARGDKSLWENNFTVNATTQKDNPILKEFKSVSELYEFVEDIYGALKKNISTDAKENMAVKTIAGRGYEKKYATYRNEYINELKQYVNRGIDRPTFEANTGVIIPPAEIEDIRQLPPYERAVEIESRARQLAVRRIKQNLMFAKQALKTGIYAPDMQQSDMKGVVLEEYKSLYYRIADDLVEIDQRMY